MVDLSVIGVFTREEGGAPFLMLHPRGLGKVVCLRLSPVEALALSMALRERAGGFAVPPVPAPELSASPVLSGLLSHELMVRLVEALGGHLLAVELPRMEGEDVTAELVLKTSGGFVRLNCRPADAITLALRCGAMIRMDEHLLAACAEDTDTAPDALPEYMRAVIKDKGPFPARTQGGQAGPAPVFPEKKTALAEAPAPADPRRQIIDAAKKILEQQGLYEGLEKILTGIKAVSPGQSRDPRSSGGEIKFVSVGKDDARSENAPGGADKPVTGKEGDGSEAAAASRPGGISVPDGGATEPRQSPSIRVSLVRRRATDKAGTPEEAPFSTGGIPRDVLVSLGLSRSEADALGREPTDGDRWALLLRMLSPETKVPM